MLATEGTLPSSTWNMELETWNCARCARCCRWPGHVLLAGEDIRALSGHLGLDEEDFINRHTVLAANRAQLSLAEGPEGTCIFLEGNACRVYEARPAQCRGFPRTWTVANGCPQTQKSTTDSPFCVVSLLQNH